MVRTIPANHGLSIPFSFNREVKSFKVNAENQHNSNGCDEQGVKTTGG